MPLYGQYETFNVTELIFEWRPDLWIRVVNTPSSLLESAVVMSQLVNRKILEFLHPMYKIECLKYYEIVIFTKHSQLFICHRIQCIIIQGTHDKSYATYVLLLKQDDPKKCTGS